MEDTIDLSKYLDMLIYRWYAVVGGILLAVLVVGAMMLGQPQAYQARVLVATMKTSTQVSFDTAITTVSEDASKTADRNQRRASFLELASNPAIAKAVLLELEDTLPADLRSEDALRKLVSSKIANGTDLIELTVAHPDRDVATRVAQAWAELFVSYINRLYGGIDETPYLIVHQERLAAEETYLEQVEAYQALLEKGRLGEIQRQINKLRTALNAGADAQGTLVSQLLAEITRVERLISDATDLATSIRNGGEDSAESSRMAIQLLKIEAFTRDNPKTTFELQHEVPAQALSVDQAAHDLDSLIEALRTRREMLGDALDTVTASLDGKPIPTAEAGVDDGYGRLHVRWVHESSSTLEQSLRDLEAEYEAEQNRLQQSRERRNLAWETLDTLLRKEAELEIANQAQGAEVKVASAPTVTEPSLVSLARPIALAAIAGGTIGVFAVFAIEFLIGYRERMRARATGIGRETPADLKHA